MPEKLLCPSYGISKSLIDQITANSDDILNGKAFIGSNGDIQYGSLILSGNASASDVRSGKTFYSTNAKSKLTGSLKVIDVNSTKVTFYKNSSLTLNRGELAFCILANLGNSHNPSCTNITGGTILYKSSSPIDSYAGQNTPTNKYSLWGYLIAGLGKQLTISGAEWKYIHKLYWS